MRIGRAPSLRADASPDVECKLCAQVASNHTHKAHELGAAGTMRPPGNSGSVAR